MLIPLPPTPLPERPEYLGELHLGRADHGMFCLQSPCPAHPPEPYTELAFVLVVALVAGAIAGARAVRWVDGR